MATIDIAQKDARVRRTGHARIPIEAMHPADHEPGFYRAPRREMDREPDRLGRRSGPMPLGSPLMAVAGARDGSRPDRR